MEMSSKILLDKPLDYKEAQNHRHIRLAITSRSPIYGFYVESLSNPIRPSSASTTSIAAPFLDLYMHEMQDAPKNGALPVQTLQNNIMASTVLASTAITLCSLIALLMTSRTRGAFFVFGNRSEFAFSIKFFAILVCFLVAFLFNVQSIRYYSHGSMLINVPPLDRKQPYPTRDYVISTVNRGSYFWSLGLRAFYFSFPLCLWLFGPIPMFLSCIVLVVMLYFLDFTFQFNWHVGDDDSIPIIIQN